MNNPRQFFFKPISGFGLLLGALCFAASLTPSLIPRTYVIQGALSGMAIGAGYGIGVILQSIWRYLELPGLPAAMRRTVHVLLTLLCGALVVISLYHAKAWQNSVRAVLDMEPVETGYPFSVSWIAVLTFLVLLVIARLLLSFGWLMAKGFYRRFPKRVSVVLGVALASVLVVTLTNGVLIKYTFRILDRSFQQYDALLEPDRPQPVIAERAGSINSKLDWRELGRAGREFVSSGPTASDIMAFTQRPALEPIRMYAGLQVAETPEERSRILLEELIRVKAFDRQALVIITPTGTGWVDPAAMDGLEYLLDGNVASVALQYSYLNSPMSLLFQPESGMESAQALFRTIHDYWKELPAQTRPKLYLHGLSLGAFNSQRSFNFFEILGDPIQGGVWSGPPFPSEMWRTLTNNRQVGTPEWLPIYEDGRFVRFMNQDGTYKGQPQQPWGDVRFVYLQYASDAITFFERSLLYREADWMKQPRGPDVSPLLEWYPVVSMLQVLVDMPLSDTVPLGYGHVYSPDHYLNAWLEVTGVDSWDLEKIAALKSLLLQRSRSGDGYEYRGG